MVEEMLGRVMGVGRRGSGRGRVEMFRVVVFRVGKTEAIDEVMLVVLSIEEEMDGNVMVLMF